MQDGQHLKITFVNAVGDNVGRAIDDQLARPFYASDTANRRPFGQSSNAACDYTEDTPRGGGAILGDVVADVIKAPESPAGPADC
jgi:hypothetical protein